MRNIAPGEWSHGGGKWLHRVVVADCCTCRRQRGEVIGITGGAAIMPVLPVFPLFSAEIVGSRAYAVFIPSLPKITLGVEFCLPKPQREYYNVIANERLSVLPVWHSTC